MKRKSKRKCRIEGSWWRVWGRQETWGYNRQINPVCRWCNTTRNHNFWGTAVRSWWARQVEGNCIDTRKRWRMLGTCVLREAEKSSGNVKTLADSTEVQPLTFQCIYSIFLAVWWECMCEVGHFGYPRLSRSVWFVDEQKYDWHLRHWR